MPWVRLDHEMDRHPKVMEAGPLAFAMYVSALCYCNRYLTDGFVRAKVAPTLGNVPRPAQRIRELLDAGLWDKAEGGYQVHDYLDYQASAAEIRGLQAKRSAAGRKGGQTSKLRGSKPEANEQANASANGKRPLSEDEAKSNSNPKPNPNCFQLPRFRVTQEAVHRHHPLFGSQFGVAT